MIRLDEHELDSIKETHWDWFRIRAKRKKYVLKLTNGEEWNLSYAAILLFFFGWTESDLKEIVLVSAENIRKYVDKNSLFYRNFISNYNSLKMNLKNYNPVAQQPNLRRKKDEIDVILEKMFGYDDFLGGIVEPFENESYDKKTLLTEWNAYSFTKTLGIDVCPYCNRQYVFTLKKGNGRPEIDHFYPKSVYPYLSCSLANFIPSCHSCNHQKSDDYNIHVLNGDVFKPNIFYIKNRSQTVYPYKESFDSLGVKFCLSYQKKSAKKVFFQFDYLKNSFEWKRIKNTINAFHLREYYNSQQLEINDLLKRYNNYARPKIKDILDTIIYPMLIDEINALKENISPSQDADKYVQPLMEKIVESYIQNTKNEILGIPVDNPDNKEYPFKKFKKDLIEQFDDEQKMIHYWAWGGKYIGFRIGECLYSPKGRPIGYFTNKDVHDFDGEYLCEIKEGRLIVKTDKCDVGDVKIKPYKKCGAFNVDLVALAMPAGYQDFVWDE